MALSALEPSQVRTSRALEVLPEALFAAEMGEPYDFDRSALAYVDELFSAVPELRDKVPFATLRLLERLTDHALVSVRCQTANTLIHLESIYPEEVIRLLMKLAGDPARRVRKTATAKLEHLQKKTL